MSYTPSVVSHIDKPAASGHFALSFLIKKGECKRLVSASFSQVDPVALFSFFFLKKREITSNFAYWAYFATINTGKFPSLDFQPLLLN